MRLTCVGTGTAVPQADRVCSGYLLEAAGLRVLMDCGGGVVHGLARLHAPWQTITHLLLSHFHNDHIGDVPLLFFAWKHGMRPGRSRPLTVLGPVGTRALIASMAELFGSHLSDPGFELRIDELGGGEVRALADGLSLACTRTPHTDNSLAYRLESNGRSLCFTGDTGPSTDVAAFAAGVDLLLMECSLPDEDAMPTHLSPSHVAAMARTARPRRLLLTHMYPQLDRGRVPALVNSAGWPGELMLADDGLRIEL